MAAAELNAAAERKIRGLVSEKCQKMKLPNWFCFIFFTHFVSVRVLVDFDALTGMAHKYGKRGALAKQKKLASGNPHHRFFLLVWSGD